MVLNNDLIKRFKRRRRGPANNHQGRGKKKNPVVKSVNKGRNPPRKSGFSQKKLALSSWTKRYLLLLVSAFLAVVILSFMPTKIWALGFLIAIAYITNLVDAVFHLPLKIETGVATILALTAAKADFWVLASLLLIGIFLPHLQTAYFFRPMSLTIYVWLLIMMKITSVLFFSPVVNALIGVIIFNIGFFFLASINGIPLRGSRTFWSLVKNILIVLALQSTGVLGLF